MCVCLSLIWKEENRVRERDENVAQGEERKEQEEGKLM